MKSLFARCRAFSIVEMTLVLLIMSIVASLFVAHETSVVRDRKKDNVQMRLQTIQDALVDFRRVNHRLPCPADGALTIASHNWGLEYGSPDNCTDGAATTGVFSGVHIVMGTVPTKALGLADDFMYDLWGRKFSYAIDPRVTGTCAFTVPPLNNLFDTTTSLTVNDELGAHRTTRALYVIVSHGPNGHGGFLPSGARENGASTNADELANCQCQSNATPNPTATTINTIFAAHLPTDSSADPQNRFDDIVAYANREQILSQAEQEGITGGEACTGGSSSSSSSGSSSGGSGSSASGSSGGSTSSSSGSGSSSGSSGSSGGSTSSSGGSGSSSGGSSSSSSSSAGGPPDPCPNWMITAAPLSTPIPDGCGIASISTYFNNTGIFLQSGVYNGGCAVIVAPAGFDANAVICGSFPTGTFYNTIVSSIGPTACASDDDCYVRHVYGPKLCSATNTLLGYSLACIGGQCIASGAPYRPAICSNPLYANYDWKLEVAGDLPGSCVVTCGETGGVLETVIQGVPGSTQHFCLCP